MTVQAQRILVTGATGKIGRAVLKELAGRPAIRASSRNAKAAGLPEGIEIAEGDLTDAQALEKALIGIDTVFLLWPFLTAEEAGPVIKLITRQARRVVYLSTAGAGDAADRATNPISATHHAIEQLVEEALTDWTMVRPSSFASNASVFWSGQIAGGDIVRWPFAQARLSPVHDGDIAAVIARAVADIALIGHKLLLTGPETISQADEVGIVGRTLGRSLRFEELPREVARQQMLGWGMPAPIVDGVLGYWEKRVTQPEPITDTIAQVVGRPARPFSAWVAENVAKFG